MCTKENSFMKHSLKLLGVASLLFFMASCSSQKSVAEQSNSEKSSVVENQTPEGEKSEMKKAEEKRLQKAHVLKEKAQKLNEKNKK